jgi:phospholipase/carboxylesterase
MLTTRRAFLVTAASFAAAPRASARQEPLAPQAASPHALGPGPNPLGIGNDRDGVIYIPKGYAKGIATPLVIALHGAGGSGAGAEFAFRYADEFGVIVLAPDSRDWTWDSVLGRVGPDTEFLGAAFQSTVVRCTVDRSRMALAGFSDGASHVLSVGIANGDVFGHLMAFSPGLMRPPAARGTPRIFISHGTNDQTMPIDDTSRKFVPRLKSLGYDVTYEEFAGRHTLPPEIGREAFSWFAKDAAKNG